MVSQAERPSAEGLAGVSAGAGAGARIGRVEPAAAAGVRPGKSLLLSVGRGAGLSAATKCCSTHASHSQGKYAGCTAFHHKVVSRKCAYVVPLA